MSTEMLSPSSGSYWYEFTCVLYCRTRLCQSRTPQIAWALWPACAASCWRLRKFIWITVFVFNFPHFYSRQLRKKVLFSLTWSFFSVQREYRCRFTNTDTMLFCMRVMVGVIILYDHVHPVGAFAKTSKIDVRPPYWLTVMQSVDQRVFFTLQPDLKIYTNGIALYKNGLYRLNETRH